VESFSFAEKSIISSAISESFTSPLLIWMPFALLMGMKTGATTLKNSMEFPQKVKNRTAL